MRSVMILLVLLLAVGYVFWGRRHKTRDGINEATADSGSALELYRHGLAFRQGRVAEQACLGVDESPDWKD